MRQLPKVDALLAQPAVASLADEHGRARVLELLRRDLDALRHTILAGQPVAPRELEPEACVARLERALAQQAESSYPAVLNATGVILHTGLGRAPLAVEAQTAIADASRYALVEVDRASGERGQRDRACAALLRELTGAEDACVVNNNAGATLIALAALAAGRPVIVSRGQLVEIGGSYRIPDVMEQSGARLVEVGTTNRTHLRDYSRALDAHPETALLLRVHCSNFRVEGFTKEVGLDELVRLGRERGVQVMDDLGSGCFLDLEALGLPPEPVVSASVRAGANVLTFSGDKLLGGPQAGLIVGDAETVGRIRAHPLYRALRPGKLTLAGLEATLKLYRDPARARARIPAQRMIHASLESLRPRAQALLTQLSALPGSAELIETASRIGGGSYAVEALPSLAVAYAPADVEAGAFAARLRRGTPVVFARVHEGRLLFDLRTLLDADQDAALAAAVRDACA
ncbi:MAG: L-seryl-tRNA(Sec) selenium transferase [Planctomycetes bacterium]|nr:L-seryl-tRNA(Sec) selenium transferase [Planctomycetota bacterium]